MTAFGPVSFLGCRAFTNTRRCGKISRALSVAGTFSTHLCLQNFNLRTYSLQGYERIYAIYSYIVVASRNVKTPANKLKDTYEKPNFPGLVLIFQVFLAGWILILNFSGFPGPVQPQFWKYVKTVCPDKGLTLQMSAPHQSYGKTILISTFVDQNPYSLIHNLFIRTMFFYIAPFLNILDAAYYKI